MYKSVYLEGIAVTFADAVDFINNVNNGHISVDDMLKLKGLKDSWEFVLNTMDELNTDYIKKVHFEICKGQNVYSLGDYRDNEVGITGNFWRPNLQMNCNYDEELDNILNIKDDLDRCLILFFLYSKLYL